MNTRPVCEEDIEAIINLFRVNYGEDYAIPEFYDPQWVKRGIYSDHINWLVIEDAGRVVASGACILNAGDYNDQIGEIGRLVVEPTVGGRGLGRALLAALVDASDEQVEFAFAEARTVHIQDAENLRSSWSGAIGFSAHVLSNDVAGEFCTLWPVVWQWASATASRCGDGYTGGGTVSTAVAS